MLDEFDDFVTSSGLINDSLAARDIPLIFVQSMMTQIDEINKSRHLEGTFLEFLEMICRLADLASCPPVPGEGLDYNELTLSERREQRLSVKIENCIPILIQNCCDRKFIGSFRHPKKDPKRDLYIL